MNVKAVSGWLSLVWSDTCSEHSSNLYEVTHQVQTSSVIPWLSKVLTLIQSTLQLAQDFNDKVWPPPPPCSLLNILSMNIFQVQVFEKMGVALQSWRQATAVQPNRPHPFKMFL